MRLKFLSYWWMNVTHIKLIRNLMYVESSPKVIRIVPLIFVPECISDTLAVVVG